METLNETQETLNAPTETTNYKLKLFTPEGNVDLLGVYNTALQSVDINLKQISDAEKSVSTKVTALEGKVTDLEGKVTALEGKVKALEGKVTALESKVPTIGDGDKALNVDEIGKAKLTANGFVYCKAQG